MLISVLCSGSSGNCTYVETHNHKILIDLGMNLKYISSKLDDLGVNISDIDIVCVTHTHSDHTGAMKTFFKKYNPIVLMDPKMLPELDFLSEYPDLCFDNGNIVFDTLSIEVIKTSHDAPGSRAYIIREDNSSMIYITDTGYINHKLFDKMTNLNLYVFEANHDIEMLMHGKYPAWLKARVRGDEGHLSNTQAAFYLSKVIGPDTKNIILAHLSEENNMPELALKEVSSVLEDYKNIKLTHAFRNEKTEVFEI